MKLNPKEKIELATSSDPNKATLKHVYLDTEFKQVVATDGYIIACVAVRTLDEDVSGCIPIEAVKMSRKTGEELVASNESKCKVGDVAFERMVESKFKGYESFLPNCSDHDTVIAIDVELLWKLAQALGAKGLKMSFKNGAGTAIKVTPTSTRTSPLSNRFSHGSIMPLRIS